MDKNSKGTGELWREEKAVLLLSKNPLSIFLILSATYNTEIEKDDEKFLQSLGNVINPNGEGKTNKIF